MNQGGGLWKVGEEEEIVGWVREQGDTPQIAGLGAKYWYALITR